MKVRALVFVAFFLLLGAFFGVKTSLAQFSNTGTVVNIEIADLEATVGDILSVTSGGIVRSSTPYDQNVFGIIVESPVVSSGEITENTVPVLSAGRALVKVTADNGEIIAGDFITTSQTPGVGQKATDVGFVVGRALEDYSAGEIGLISVQISVIEFGKQDLGGAGGILGAIFGALNVGFSDSSNFPIILRYISAATIGVVTFIIAGVSFVRFMSRGIEAIGRNPMARKVIVAGMVINAVIVFLLTAAGFGIAIAIIVL